MNTAPTTIIKAYWNTHQNSLKNIRQEVFITEQNISPADEWDNADNNALHYLAIQQHKTIACARMIINNNEGKIGRVAVLQAYRRKNIATELLTFIIQEAITLQLSTLLLDAQIDVLNLYKKLGFTAYGDTFFDAGILHQKMCLDLAEQVGVI